jgi:hypothetical protein
MTINRSNIIQQAIHHHGKTDYMTIARTVSDLFEPFAWPGGYLVIFVDLKDGEFLCPKCAKYEVLIEHKNIMASCDEEFDSVPLICGRCGSFAYPDHLTDCGCEAITEGVEVFNVPDDYECTDDDGDPLTPGWYYWYVQPGCLPDTDPIGPHDSARDARRAAGEEVLDFLRYSMPTWSKS